ncbi:MAG: hypothetical protein ACKO0V_00880 [bacterium]
MPRIISGLTPDQTTPLNNDLLQALVHELRSSHESGQPVIHEQTFPATGKIKVTVLWDSWEKVPFEERAEIIRKAYLKAEVVDSADKLALLVGLTFPEAYEEGILPYQVVPLLRKGDPVTSEQCLQAMRNEGASALFPGLPAVLRFATEIEAETARKRLVRQLPPSEQVWAIMMEAGIVMPITEN